MSSARHSETAFGTVIVAHLFQNGYISVTREGFDRERAFFPGTVLEFIRKTQSTEWIKLEALIVAAVTEQIDVGGAA